jgi:protein tyrosine/serine phosphatase
MREDDRFVPLQGSFNCRDLGGLAAREGRSVRRGLVFRSDALHHITPADVALLRDRIGVRTQIDLRASREVEKEGRGPLAAPPVAYRHLPFFDGERSGEGPPEGAPLAEIYFSMLHFARRAIARALETLAAADAPALFHCAAGKDRTGVLSAVVLGALGVGDADIVADYAFSRLALPRIVERLRASESYQYVFTELPPETLHADPETMARLLELARGEWGSWREYARFAGASGATLEALAGRMLG